MKKPKRKRSWRDIQGWFDWQPLYSKMAEEVPADGLIVELGVWRGCSISYLGERLLALGKSSVKVVGVDNFFGGDDTPEVYSGIRSMIKGGDVFKECQKNLKACEVDSVVSLIREDTVLAAAKFADRSVNFLFIDSSHTPDRMRRELTVWLPKMKRHTWIAGHDIHGTYLREAIVEFFPNYTVEGSCWVGQLT